jgi:Fe-S-cluster formation regulator IscX/YfhJ
VGSILANHLPDFDPRHYGFPKLSSLMASLEAFEVEKRGPDDAPQLFVRPKRSLTNPAEQST